MIPLNALKEYIKLNSRLKILDIGCGNGKDLIALARKFPGNEYYGFDINFNGRREVDVGGTKIELVYGNALKEWPFNEKFKIIYSSNMLHELKIVDWKQFFKSVRKHLEQDGIFVILDTRTKEGKKIQIFYEIEELINTLKEHFQILSVKEWTQHDLFPEPHNHQMILVVCKK